MASLPLSGVRVLDCTVELGELAGRILGDLGADVVRIEPPEGAPSRAHAPRAPDGTSLWFAHRAVNERSVVLDLGDPAGRDRLDGLAAGADVLLESSGPGGLAARDAALDPQALARRHAQLVVCSISHFGADGPRAHWAGTDLVDAAAGAHAYRFGPAGLPPLAPPGSMASDSAGIAAAVIVVAALHQRRTIGRGQWIDVSAAEAMANLGDWSLPIFSNLGVDQVRDGAGTLYPIYRCADGHLRMVSPISNREWAPLVEWLGNPDELSDPDWAQPAIRMSRLAQLREIMTAFFADKPRDATVDDGVARGLAVAPILRPGEVLEHPHFASRDTFVDVAVSPTTTARLVNGFVSVDGARAGIRTPPPAIGAHTDTVAWEPRSARGTPALGVRGTPIGTATRPYAGLRVLDFGIGGVGVECGRILAELGADVVKVESFANPDFQRVVLGGLMNAPFASSSRSKRGLAVNLGQPEGVELVHRFAAQADVVIENRGTGALDRLGVGWSALSAANPSLVMVSSQLMGDHGTWGTWKGYGPITRAVSGLAWLWNHPEHIDDPQGVTTIHPDHQAGRWMALLVGALLLRRAETGEGGHADVAQVEVIVGQLGDLLAAESVVPGTLRPAGNQGPDAPSGVFPCRAIAGEGPPEEWIAISVRDDRDWAALVSALGAPAWTADPALAHRDARLAHRVELEAGLAAWTATRDADAAAEELQRAGIPAARLLYPRSLAADAHERARGFIVGVDQPGLGPLLLEGPAWHGAAIDPVTFAAPWPGEHSREVGREWLGLSDAELDALVADGTLEQYEV